MVELKKKYLIQNQTVDPYVLPPDSTVPSYGTEGMVLI